MSISSFKELDLFQQIAEAIGGSLEEVYNMQERERKELITVLGLEEVDYNANYQGVSPSKYRTRTVAKREKVTEREVPAALEDGEGLGEEEAIAVEILEKDLNGNIITSDRDINTSDKNSETKESDPKTGDKESTLNQRKTMLVVKQSTSSNTPDMISDLPPSPIVTHAKSSTRSRLSLKRKGRNTSVPKTNPKHITEPSLDSPDQLTPLDDVTLQPPSGYRQPVPSFLIQKLSSHSSGNTDLPGSSLQPSLPYNLIGKMLSSHPLPVQDVLARHDLPLHQGQQVAGGGGAWRKYRDELDNVFEKMSKFKSKGLVHAGTESGIIWADQKMNINKWKKKSVKMVEQRQKLRRSTRKVKKSFSISDSVFVSGDWALSSEEDVGSQTSSEVKKSKKMEDNDELPVEDEDEGGREGESEEKKRRGRKRKLFSKNKDYMDDSAESGKGDESCDEDERKRKYPGTRKGLRRTLDSLKKEGSFSDLCGD